MFYICACFCLSGALHSAIHLKNDCNKTKHGMKSVRGKFAW